MHAFKNPDPNKRQHEILASVANVVFKIILDHKSRLADDDCLIGYYAMIFSGFRAKDTTYDLPTYLIHKHLAHLIPNKKTHLNLLPSILPIQRTASDELSIPAIDGFFRPASMFPDLEKDELTQFIILMGMAKYQDTLPFVSKVSLQTCIEATPRYSKDDIMSLACVQGDANILSFSFRLIVELIWAQRDEQAPPTKHTEEPAARCGDKMEALAKGAAVKASVAGGPSGQAFQNFLLRYVEELQLVKGLPLVWKSSALETLKSICDQIVPFIMSVGYCISDTFSSIPGFYFG